jgi:hypothetical protein
MAVRVNNSGFSGEGDIWFADSRIVQFLDDLETLDANRAGTAGLDSLSPNEFRLTLTTAGPHRPIVVSGTLSPTRSDPQGLLRRAVSFAFHLDAEFLNGTIRDLTRFFRG